MSTIFRKIKTNYTEKKKNLCYTITEVFLYDVITEAKTIISL